DEAAADAVGADDLAGALEEVLLEDVRLEGAARLARDDEERLPQIDLPLDSLDLRGIGRVQHVQLRVARDLAEGHLEDLLAEARAAHAEQQHVADTAAPGVGLDLVVMVDVGDLVVGDAEPAEP